MKSYFYIETYGCTANQNNSEIIKGLLKQSGYEITNNIDIAEIIIINTCIVKGKTESKIKRRIQDIKDDNKLIIIAGCMPETDYLKLKRLNKNLLFLGTHHIKDIARLLRDYYEKRLDKEKQLFYLTSKSEEKILLPKIPVNKLISITQISEGCLGECTYCKTRFAKGKLFSYDFDKIIKSIESDLKSGAKEVWITSQDNASYGIDKNHQMLPLLLKNILELKYNFKLRLGMVNPNNLYPILDEMIEVYKNKKIYKFLHLPIQSASDNVLKEMNRSYKIKIVEEILDRFNKELSSFTFATDLIVGYPTEKELDHEKNIEFLKKYKPDVLNLSKFSSHQKTKSGHLKILNKEIINKRTNVLMALHRKLSLEKKQAFIGKKISVFVNERINDSSIYKARDDNYNIILINSSDKNILGKSLVVKIEKVGVYHLIGKPIK
jgi:threonylcarbamoyladenosine tRNA methylthiotransferase CDKAL1